MLKSKTSPILLFLLTLVVIAAMALLGPEEKSLGANVRLVYIHGAWVLAAEVAFLAAASAGLGGLLLYRSPARSAAWHRWSAALGRTGILFWITYLPLSLWAMQANWNGLFLSEPRFRLALTFAVVGLLLQIGLWVLSTPWLTSAGNIVFIIALRLIFSQAANIMHPPPSPIFNSGLWNVIAFFLGLNLLALTAAYFMTLAWLRLAPQQN